MFFHARSGDHSAWTHADAGKRTHLHVTAAGKAILAHLPEERTREIVDRRGLPPKTDATITDEETLLEELKEIRSRGIAINRGENIDGIRAVGAPVRGADRNVIGAFSVSGPANQLTREPFKTELPEMLLVITNEFELELQLT